MKIELENSDPSEDRTQKLQRRVGVALFCGVGGNSSSGSSSSGGWDGRRKKRICRAPSMIGEHPLREEVASTDDCSVVLHGEKEGWKLELADAARFLSPV